MSRRRVKVMPSIREESNLKSSRIPVHIIPPGSRSMCTARGSMIIQTLPEDTSRPAPKVTPSSRYHDNVEQVVSDYLHFARYGKVLPVSRGFAPLPCPCCSDRNRENVMLMKERFRAPPPEPDPDDLPEPLSASTAESVTRGNHTGPRRTASPRRSDTDPRGVLGSWLDYQPAPYAQTYLNSEFYRTALLQGYDEDRRQYDEASMAYVASRVLDANTKYDLAMKKLEQSLNNFSVSREESDVS